MDESRRRAVESHLLTTSFPAPERERIRQRIGQRVLDEGLVDAPDFTRISQRALSVLGEAYDRAFFGGTLGPLLDFRRGDLRYRLAPRLTRTGGKTTRLEFPKPDRHGRSASFEIAIATQILFQSFRDPQQPEVVTGVRCHHRLDALQRIFEHELIHLAEMLVWYDSSCSAQRFRGIAERWFGHTESTHRLPTASDIARRTLGIRTGSRVRFEHEGEVYRGFVNRISRRATVLVEHPQGTPYDDGRRYKKFYVPLQLLREDGRP
ncbi:MAG TPA: hypothetical protein PLI18_12385 [Pirellulaceae bacterium]|nr:hypothetical protein [Pirellulaceae bacterium]